MSCRHILPSHDSLLWHFKEAFCNHQQGDVDIILFLYVLYLFINKVIFYPNTEPGRSLVEVDEQPNGPNSQTCVECCHAYQHHSLPIGPICNWYLFLLQSSMEGYLQLWVKQAHHSGPFKRHKLTMILSFLSARLLSRF